MYILPRLYLRLFIKHVFISSFNSACICVCCYVCMCNLSQLFIRKLFETLIIIEKYAILIAQRKNKYFDAKLKALKARNEYVLCLEASNATVHKYFVEDVSDLIDCMDFGFHQCITRSLYMHTTAEQGRIKSLQLGMEALRNIVNSMDSRHDKQRFLEFNHTAFMLPKKFEYQGLKDEVCTF